MATLGPEWSAKIDEFGTPRDPLNTDRSRNRVTNLFAHGLVTSTAVRLRYLSVFCWALDTIPEQVDEENGDEQYDRLKNIEKLFCLATQYRSLRDNVDSATEAMDGNTRFSIDDEAFDHIELDTIELLDGDNYAYDRIYEGMLQKFLLKRGGFTLTEAGESLATHVATVLGDEAEVVHRCAAEGEASREDFEAISGPLANHAIYSDDGAEAEQAALTKVLLGVIERSGSLSDPSIQIADDLTESLSLSVLDRLQTALESEQTVTDASAMQHRLQRGFHRYRGAYSLFLLRARQLRDQASEGPVSLTERDGVFHQFQTLMRPYWLQVYLGYALEAQLEIVCSFLNTRVPARYPFDELLDSATNERIVRQELGGFLDGIIVDTTEEDRSLSEITRDLLLYGGADTRKLTVERASEAVSTTPTLGEVRNQVREWATQEWDTVPPVAGIETPNEVLLARAINLTLSDLTAEAPLADRLDTFRTVLVRSSLLVLLAVERFSQLGETQPWFHEYASNRLDSAFASLPALTRYLNGRDSSTAYPTFVRELFNEQVVQTHLRVFYDRLSPGNLKRILSFDQDDRLCLEVDADYGKRPVTASARFVRFSEMNALLRDCGLFVDGSEKKYRVSTKGEQLLASVLGGENT